MNTKSNKGLVKQGRSAVSSEEEAVKDKLVSDIPTLDGEQRTSCATLRWVGIKEGMTPTRSGITEVLKMGPKGIWIQVCTCYSFDCQLTFLHRRKEREQGYKDINCSDILIKCRVALEQIYCSTRHSAQSKEDSLASGRALVVRITCILALKWSKAAAAWFSQDWNDCCILCSVCSQQGANQKQFRWDMDGSTRI